MKKKRVFYILLYIVFAFCLVALCVFISCATTKGGGSQTGTGGQNLGRSGPGFRLFGGSLPVSESELIGGVIILIIILVSIIVIRQIVSKRK